MSYKPLPDCLTIKESPIHGLGVFATKNIEHNVAYAICNTHLELRQSNNKISSNPIRLLRLEAGGFINHSVEPNVELRTTLIPYENDYKNWKYLGIYTLRDIKEGEEILLNYNSGYGLSCGYKNEEWLNK